MKANELMIGDWVRSKLHNVNSKVTDIEWQGDFGSVWLEEKKCWERHFDNEIKPISLTTKMMEVNFPTPDDGVTWWPNNKPFFHVECCPLNGTRVCMPYTQYVHELQHILRLCGIDKEIVIK